MPYGVMSTETQMRLRETGLEDAWNLEGYDTVTIDIVCSGALDESFEIQAGYEKPVVNVLAEMLNGNSDLDEWEVVAYIPEGDTLYSATSHPTL